MIPHPLPEDFLQREVAREAETDGKLTIFFASPLGQEVIALQNDEKITDDDYATTFKTNFARFLQEQQ